MRNCYSSLKVFHHQDRLQILKRGGTPYPIHVQIVPTNRCNHDCEFCAYRISGYTSNEDFHSTDTIPIEKLLEIVDSCKEMGVRAIEITGGGEPTVHPEFPKLCQAIGDADIDYGVVTNGSMMNEQILNALVGAKWVRVSIDAANQWTYAEERKVKPMMFARVRTNVSKLYNLRESLGKSDPVIGVGFVVTHRNHEEILEAVENAKADGADNIRISAFFQSQGAKYFRTIFPEILDQCNQAKALEDDRFTVFDMFRDRMQDLSQGRPDYEVCNTQKLCTYVGADLNVYRCCVLAYNHRGKLGSLNEQTLAQLWTSQVTDNLLTHFNARECPRCMFNGKNHTIAYAIDRDPEHVNFI